MANPTIFQHEEYDGQKNKLFHYTESGLDNIWLVGGVNSVMVNDQEHLFIDHRDVLHEEIGKQIIRRGDRISGRELRFLRHELNVTQEHLAKWLESDVQAVARWEKGRAKVPGPADRLIRFLYSSKIGQFRPIQEFLEELAEQDRLTQSAQARQRYLSTPEGWRKVA